MRVIQTLVAIAIIAALIVWVRGGDSFHIVQSIPLLDGEAPKLLYIVGAVVMALIFFSGISRLLHPPDETEKADDDDRLDDEPDDEDFEDDELDEREETRTRRSREDDEDHESDAAERGHSDDQ